MNILVVTQYYYPEPFRINEICEELVRRGHEVTVLTGLPNYPDGDIYDGYKNERKEEFVKGVKVIRCKIRPRKKGSINLLLNYLSFWVKARLAVRKLPNNFDLVYSYQLSPIISISPGCWYSKKFHRPHFLYCLDLWPESVVENISPKSPIYKYISWLSKRIYSSADIIGVTSPSFINYLSNLINRPKAQIVYIPQHARDIACPTRVGEQEELSIVFTGNIGATQNLDVLVDAVNIIKEERGFKVTIVGSGSDLERLKEKVIYLGLEHIISFTGRQPKDKMPDYYSMADFCFLSLRDEGSVSWTIPGKLQEYMSAGRAVLACIKGDAKDVINDADCGIVVDDNDINSLAMAMKEIANNIQRIKEYGRNARNYYLKHFTLEKHVDQLEELLLSMLINQ